MLPQQKRPALAILWGGARIFFNDTRMSQSNVIFRNYW